VDGGGQQPSGTFRIGQCQRRRGRREHLRPVRRVTDLGGGGLDLRQRPGSTTGVTGGDRPRQIRQRPSPGDRVDKARGSLTGPVIQIRRINRIHRPGGLGEQDQRPCPARPIGQGQPDPSSLDQQSHCPIPVTDRYHLRHRSQSLCLRDRISDRRRDNSSLGQQPLSAAMSTGTVRHGLRHRRRDPGQRQRLGLPVR
jgi:hypothetical protein